MFAPWSCVRKKQFGHVCKSIGANETKEGLNTPMVFPEGNIFIIRVSLHLVTLPNTLGVGRRTIAAASATVGV